MAGNGVYNSCLQHLGTAEINWTTSNTTHWCCLLGNTAPTKTHVHYSNLAGELAATGGYVVGGQQLAPTTASVASAITTFAAASNTVFGSNDQTYSAYYAVNHTGATKTTDGPLITYHNMTGPISPSSGTLTITWNASGVFTLTSSAET